MCMKKVFLPSNEKNRSGKKCFGKRFYVVSLSSGAEYLVVYN